MRSVWILGAVIPLGACGGGGISVRGELADGFPAVDRVYAVEAGREAPVRGGRFQLEGLGAAPISLRLLAGGDTVAWMDLGDAPAGGTLTLRELRLDRGSRRAFPDRVDGAELLTVNGVRFGAAPVPGEARGVVLAAAGDGSALLLRTHGRGPDLRVAVADTTRVVTSDGEPVQGWSARAGDSLGVAGTVREGIVHATRLTLPPEPDYPPDQPVVEPDAAERPEARSPEGEGRGRDRPGRGRGRGKAKGRG